MQDFIPLSPTPFSAEDDAGKVWNYILTKFDAVTGRKIMTQYPLSGMPKIGDYDLNEQLMFLLMEHVCVEINGNLLPLSTPQLIKNHCGDAEVLLKVEQAMMVKNFSFFRDGRSWDFLENFTQMLLGRISEMLTRLSEQSSPTEKQPSTNSELSTH